MSLDNVCKTCYRKVQSFCYKICCQNCRTLYHAKCVSIDKNDIGKYDLWYCPHCLKEIFVYNHIDDDNDFYTAIMEEMSDWSYDFHEINSKVFVPFEINEQFDTPLIEIDPDMQFYLESNYIKNTKCDYYLEHTFVKNITRSEQQKNAI